MVNNSNVLASVHAQSSKYRRKFKKDDVEVMGRVKRRSKRTSGKKLPKVTSFPKSKGPSTSLVARQLRKAYKSMRKQQAKKSGGAQATSAAADAVLRLVRSKALAQQTAVLRAVNKRKLDKALTTAVKAGVVSKKAALLKVRCGVWTRRPVLVGSAHPSLVSPTWTT